MILPTAITVTARFHGRGPDFHHYIVGPSRWGVGIVSIRTLTHTGEPVAPRWPAHDYYITAFCQHTMTQFTPGGVG